MRWTLPMADAVLQLRAVYLSEHFEEYWAYHVDEDKKRLYQSTKWRPLVAKKCHTQFISVGNAKEYPAQPASGRQR